MAGPESCSFFFMGSVFLRCVLPGFLGSVLLNPCPACFFGGVSVSVFASAWIFLGGQCFSGASCLFFLGGSVILSLLQL